MSKLTNSQKKRIAAKAHNTARDAKKAAEAGLTAVAKTVKKNDAQ